MPKTPTQTPIEFSTRSSLTAATVPIPRGPVPAEAAVSRSLPLPTDPRFPQRAVTDAAADLDALASVMTDAESFTDRAMAGFIRRYRPMVDGQRPSIRGMVTLPLLVYGAERAETDPARPAAVVHLLWWMAARYLDDLVDADQEEPSGGAGQREAAVQANRDTLTAFAVGTHLADGVLDAPAHGCEANGRLRRELTRCWLEAIDGQLRDLSETPDTAGPDSVLRSYRGKTGAPYAMAAALAAILADCDEQRTAAWHDFGIQLGALRQLANDRRDLLTGRHEDLRNRTATYHLASYLHELPGDRRAEVLRLSDAAARDPKARATLAALLTDPHAVQAYTESVTPMFARAHAALAALGGRAAYVSALHGLVEETADMLTAVS